MYRDLSIIPHNCIRVSNYHNKNVHERRGPVAPKRGLSLTSEKLSELKYPKVSLWVLRPGSDPWLLLPHPLPAHWAGLQRHRPSHSRACSSLRTFALLYPLPKSICFPSAPHPFVQASVQMSPWISSPFYVFICFLSSSSLKCNLHAGQGPTHLSNAPHTGSTLCILRKAGLIKGNKLVKLVK